LLITDNAKRDMKRIPRGDLTSIDAAIAALASNPRPTQSKKLAGTEGYRRRVGNYRILYSIEDSRREVTVLRVKDRKDAYR
jgi:mRNA interferase RelE/StbE